MLGDTWVLDSGGWRQVSSQFPARWGHAMAYDPRRNRVVCYGGFGPSASFGPYLGDTWEWDGALWQMKDVLGGPARRGTSMAYDAVRNHVLRFGGTGNALPGSVQTWIYTTTRPAPSPQR